MNQLHDLKIGDGVFDPSTGISTEIKSAKRQRLYLIIFLKAHETLFTLETKSKDPVKFTVPALNWGVWQKGVLSWMLPFLTPC